MILTPQRIIPYPENLLVTLIVAASTLETKISRVSSFLRIDNIMYSINVTVPATTEPVSVSELKAQLRLNTSDEDSFLGELISAARDTFETLTGLYVLPTTIRQYMPSIPPVVYLMRAPITSIVSFSYYDVNDNLQTTSSYYADITGVPGSLWFPDGNPTLSVKKYPKCYIDFVCGMGVNSDKVPAKVKVGVKLLAAHWFENRSAYVEKSQTPLPMGFLAIVDQYKTGLTGAWGAIDGREQQVPYHGFYPYCGVLA